MSTPFLLRPLGLLMAMTTLVCGAEPAPKCSKIAQDVAESVTKEPSKVLMIVEDALVINESCACEIIKAAIQASADITSAMVRVTNEKNPAKICEAFKVSRMPAIGLATRQAFIIKDGKVVWHDPKASTTTQADEIKAVLKELGV
jgi:hypothetical protein